MNDIVQMLKALGDETRLKILIILSQRQICAKGLAKHLNISEATVSQHIKILKDTGIITGEKVGYYVHYHLQQETLTEISKFVDQIGNGSEKCSSLKFEVSIPCDCKAICKSHSNKCCRRKLIVKGE